LKPSTISTSVSRSVSKGDRGGGEKVMLSLSKHDIGLKSIFSIFLILTGLFILNSSTWAQSEMTPKLKEFLTRNDFMELIEKYGQDKISLTIKGVEQKKIEKRSYDLVQGYRCQVFAGAEYSNANEVADRIEALQLDSAYVVESSDLYKVQVGNFVERKDAQIMLDKLRYSGIEGAWIVETTVHVPKESRADQIKVASEIESGFYYAVQVFNTGHYDKAQNFKSDLERRFSEPVEIIQENDLWKIVVGRYNDHDSANSLLEQIRREGFTDAWITQIIN
jgi:hypothetical protein